MGLSDATPVVPWIVGDSAEARRLSRGLAEAGVHVAPITYPAVAEREARLRFFVSLAHDEEQIRRTLEAVRGVMAA